MFEKALFLKQKNKIFNMNTQKIIIVALLFGIALLASCIKAEEYALEPFITSVSIDKSSIHQFSNITTDEFGNILNYVPESFVISLDFQDGDGDLGITDDQPEMNAFIVDNRTDFVCLLYTSPSPRDPNRSRMPSSA